MRFPGETTEISEKSDSGDKLNQIRYFTFELWMKKKKRSKQTNNKLANRSMAFGQSSN